MKELEFLNIIKTTLSKGKYIGDDCAYLEDLGIVITQDSLVEDVHFSRKFSNAYQIGYKSIMVNLSDILASGAIPKYLTISLSLPRETESSFLEDFYKACNELAEEYDFEVVGGDITGSDKIFISICAIGITTNRKISSRKNASPGDLVVTTGVHGSSAAGLELLKSGNNNYPNILKRHLMPKICDKFSNEIATKCTSKYAMMDTSDGLADALFKISKDSNVSISIDFNKIPYDKDIEIIANSKNLDFKDWILYGGEDYQLIACINKIDLKKIDPSLYTIIGEVKEKKDNQFVDIKLNENTFSICNLDKTYNHFERNNK